MHAHAAHRSPVLPLALAIALAIAIALPITGFVLENSVAGGDSITVQFIVPSDISHGLFDRFSDMISSTFRVSGTMNLS
jgi:hypothetical protein